MEMITEYEYAGFIFLVIDDKVITAKQGQHPAAFKEKHLRAAQECYQQRQARRIRFESRNSNESGDR